MSKGGYAQISLLPFPPEVIQVADGRVKLRTHSPRFSVFGTEWLQAGLLVVTLN